MHKLRFFIILTSLGLSTLAQAETAHQHGVGVLNIVSSQQELMLELLTPADNILGFEHMPKTDQQKQQLSDSLALLQKTDLLFNIPMQAKCRLQKVNIENPFESHEEHEEKEEEHEANEEEHEEHEEHDHSEEASDTHTDFTINYTYRCEQEDQLENINIAGLFKHFSNFETLSVQWIYNNKQSAKTITKNDMVINFKQ